MRRSEREIINPEELQQILTQGRIMTMAMIDQGVPYLVTMNYGFEVVDGTYYFYLHCAKEGRKITALKEKNQVSFTIVTEAEVDGKDIPCTYTTYYQSIVGMGTVDFLEESSAKVHGLDLIMKQIGYTKEYSYHEKMLDSILLLKITVEELTGKAQKRKKED